MISHQMETTPIHQNTLSSMIGAWQKQPSTVAFETITADTVLDVKLL